MRLFRYCVIPIVARTTISVITTSSSIIVKPLALVTEGLPVFVFRSIERCTAGSRVDVENVLAAPLRRVGLVLVRAHAPLGAARHRIDRDTAQKLELAARRIVRRRYAVDEHLKIGRIVLAADLDVERSDLPEVRGVLVLVDGRAHLPERAPELRLARARRRHLREGHDRRREDDDDRRHDEQLDERVPTLRNQELHCTVTVTGLKRRPIAAPPGPVAVPLSVSVAAPGAIASKSTAASTPVPDAPVASAARVSEMSIRLPFTCWLTVTGTPPARRKLPS